jgi:WD40 repeat protein
MVVSPDGKSLFTGNRLTGISVWDLATGRITRPVPADPNLRRVCLPGSAVALSADGRTAAIAGSDATVHLLDLATGTEKQQCRGHRDSVREAVLSAGGRVLVTKSADQTLRVWDAASGKQLRQMPLADQGFDQGRPVEVALSSDGKTLAWVGNEAEQLVHVCDTLSGRERHRLGEYRGRRRRIAFSPDGQKLVSTSEEGPGQVWDVRTGRLIRELPYGRKHWPPPGAAFAPDDKAVVVTFPGDAMRLVEVATGRERWQVARHMWSTDPDEFTFTPDGKTLLVSAPALGQVLYRHDTATGQRLVSPVEPGAPFQALVFAPNERALYSFGEDGVLRTWEAATGKEVRQMAVGAGTGLFSPDGRLLAAHKEKGTHLYEAATGRELRQLAGGPPRAFSPDGQVLVATEDDGHLVPWGGALVLWEVATGKELRRLPRPTEYWAQVLFAPDRRNLLIHTWPTDHGHGGPVHFWDLAGGREFRTLSLPPHWGTLVLSPDGKTLAVPLADFMRINFLEVATGRKRLEVEPLTQWPSALGFSPDGRFFLVSHPPGSVRLYDARSGRLLLRLEGHRGEVADWAFSPTCQKMATFSQDRTALVWDLAELLRAAKETPLTLSQVELRGLWADLAGNDAARAYQAIGRLARAPAQTLPWLRRHLRPFPSPDRKRLDQLIADLDSERFEVRKRATAEIERQGESARPALQKALAGPRSPEGRRRLEQLMEKFEASRSPEQVRALRAIEVLEHLGTPEAARLLEALSRGAPEARLTQEAEAASKRLAQRPAALP